MMFRQGREGSPYPYDGLYSFRWQFDIDDLKNILKPLFLKAPRNFEDLCKTFPELKQVTVDISIGRRPRRYMQFCVRRTPP